MLTLSDHSHGGAANAHEPYVAQPHWHGTLLAIAIPRNCSRGLRNTYCCGSLWEHFLGPGNKLGGPNRERRHGTEIDEHTMSGGISASSMVSDFSTDVAVPRKIAWHTGPNPCMAAYYPVIFHHDGHVSELPDYMTSGILWWDFHYSIYALAGRDQRKVKHVQERWRPIQDSRGRVCH